MKRSEMIEQIFKDHDGKHSKNSIHEILFSLENYGMLPPKFELKKTGIGCLCTMREGCEECDSYNKYYKNEWEKE